jgi:DNA-binding MarR family transcriptional regulator
VVRKGKWKQGELFGNLNYFLTLSGIFDKDGGKGTARELKPAATAVYLCLRSMADYDTGSASISAEELGERIGATKPTVDKALAVLEEQGLVVRLNPDGGKRRRVFQVLERLPYYEALSATERAHRGWLVAPHAPRETTERLKQAKEFFQHRELPPAAMAAGVRVERVEVKVENLQVNLNITHNHYGSEGPGLTEEKNFSPIAQALVAELTAAMRQGGPVAEWAERLLLAAKAPEG